MPSLTVRGIPKATLDKMRRAARAEHRSLNSQAIFWLEQAARRGTEPPHMRELVRSIRELREAMRK